MKSTLSIEIYYNRKPRPSGRGGGQPNLNSVFLNSHNWAMISLETPDAGIISGV